MRVGLIACCGAKLDDVLQPYDVSLESMPREERDGWATRTREQLTRQWGTEAIYLCVLGEHYRCALVGFPFVEDVIAFWTRQRRDRGMSSRAAAMSIGVLTKYLREGKRYG